MNKHLFLYTAAAFFCLSLPVHADWITAPESDLTVQGGTVSARMALTGTQSLLAEIPSSEGHVMSLSFFTKDPDQPGLKLDRIPFPALQDTHMQSVRFSLIPIIQSGNGQRYYLIQTGDPEGCLIISYKDGAFNQVFSAASIPGSWKRAELKPQKKDLLLTLTAEDGTLYYYQLNWDGKAGIFQATVLQG